MTGTGGLVAFAGVMLLVLAVPGPSVMYVVTRSIAQGTRAGMWSMLGLEAGLLVHVCLSAAGLSSVLASSEIAFHLVRVAGAGYLAFLAIREFAAGRTTVAAGTAPVLGLGPARWVRDGFLVDLLNPKTSLFFLAFLPQFVDPARGAPGLQLLVLCAAVVPVAVLCDGSYALLAGYLRNTLFGSARIRRRLSIVSGSAYLLLAGGALLA